MICPRDGSRILPQKNAPGIYGCAQCHGQVLNHLQLNRILDPQVAKWAWEEIKTHGNWAIDTRCPNCANPMKRIRPMQTAAEVEIDFCQKCRLVWFDRGEEFSVVNPVKPEPILAWTKEGEHFTMLCASLLGVPIEEDPSGFQTTSPAIVALIGVTVLISLSGFRDIEFYARAWGFIPDLGFSQPHRWITAFFFHGGWGHLFSNLYFLWIVGDDVEEVLGLENAFWLLLISTLAGHFLVYQFNHERAIPHIGASGGVAGLFAFYALSFPKARLLFGKFLIFRIGYVRVPAMIAFTIFLALQFYGVYRESIAQVAISYWGHVGGAITGMITAILWRKKS